MSAVIQYGGRNYPVQSWEYQDGNVVRRWNGALATIATVNERLEWHEDRSCSLDESVVNGWLLAAAPDLLEALTRIERMSHACGCNTPCRCHTQETLAIYREEVQDAARTALAKARGE